MGSMKTAISMDKEIRDSMQSDPVLEPILNLLAEKQPLE